MPGTVTLEHYEILTRDDGSLHELGRGAMGITYKGFDTRLCVPVALKVINATNLHSENARQRFVREARSAAQLRHRNVASIFHLGEEGGSYFYVMEFIDGETVEALVRRQGPLPTTFALRIVAQVARALNAAEQHDLVHRDIKPSNLMAVVEDDDLVIKVIDFGLAKVLLAEGEASGPALTQGGILGTPHFASPEQLAERETDARSDIYSLGITLWYLLRAAPPFTGSVARIVGQQLTKPPPFDDLAALPSNVVNLLRKMLAKDPAERHQSAAELRKEVEDCFHILEGTPRPPATVAPVSAEPAGARTASLPGGSAVPIAEGTTVAGRYRIARDLNENEAGKSFLARDLQEDHDVRLLVLHQELRADPEVYARIEQESPVLAALVHPNVIAISGLTAIDRSAFLTLEWTNGFTLRQLLRSRRELPAEEAFQLLEQAATGIDYAAALLPRLELGLHHVAIHFPDPEAIKEQWLPQPVQEWPDFVVKINPLAAWRDYFAVTWTAGQTLVGGMHLHERQTVAGKAGALQAFGALIYEVLGGVATGFNAPAYTPLAALDEMANAILHRVLLDPGSFDSATELLRQLNGSSDMAQSPAILAKPAPESRAPAADPPATIVPPDRKEIATPASGLAVPAPLRRRLLVPLIALLAITAASYALFRGGPRSRSLPFAMATPPPTPVPVAETALPTTTPPATTPLATVKLATVKLATPSMPATTPFPSRPAPITPTPAPTHLELASNARRTAEDFESRQRPAEALTAWLRMNKDFPEFDAGRVGIELHLSRLRRQSGGLSKAEFAAMRPEIVQAANLGVLAAMMTLGDALRETEPEQAFAWYCTAAQMGEPSAMTQAGLMLSNGAGTPRDLRKAVAYFQEATERGEPTAITALADCYLDGDGVPKDQKQAVTLLQKAAAKGNLRAKSRLGWCYHKGIGVAADYRQAFRLFSEAAERDYPEAIGNLGVLYMNGEGVPKNPAKALEKFREASLKEDKNAMFYYARCLQNGFGIKASPADAKTWYLKSAAAGQPEAIEWCKAHGVPVKTRR